MDIIKPIAKHILEPVLAWRHGSTHLKTLTDLEKSQYLSLGELQQMQLERLRKLLIHARQNCSFYADRFADYGFDPARISRLDDLQKLPLLTKADIQKHITRMKAVNYPDDQLIPNCTGGSTGTPLRFYLDRERLASRRGATIRHDRWTGWDIGRKKAVLWGNPIDFAAATSFKEKLYTLFYDRRLILDTGNITLARLSDFVSQLKTYRPSVYLAYANSIYLFARFLKESGIRNYHRPESIITSAELLTDEQRILIEEVFECRVFNRYGCRELSVVASECPEHSGMHIAAEHLLVETIQGHKSGDSTSPEELVITDLLNYGMPLIRYQIEDCGTLLPDNCSCGRKLPRIQITGGRLTDFLITPEGKVVSGASMTIHFITAVPGITQAQIVQEQRDMLAIRIVKGQQFGNDSLKLIEQKIRKFFGPNMKFELDYVDGIETTTSGKYRFSICNFDPMEFLV